MVAAKHKAVLDRSITLDIAVHCASEYAMNGRYAEAANVLEALAPVARDDEYIVRGDALRFLLGRSVRCLNGQQAAGDALLAAAVRGGE
jgi:hypothetical protein